MCCAAGAAPLSWCLPLALRFARFGAVDGGNVHAPGPVVHLFVSRNCCRDKNVFENEEVYGGCLPLARLPMTQHVSPYVVLAWPTPVSPRRTPQTIVDVGRDRRPVQMTRYLHSTAPRDCSPRSPGLLIFPIAHDAGSLVSFDFVLFANRPAVVFFVFFCLFSPPTPA